jgi:beta-lactam-binding protein with PASTA domain
MDRRWPRLALIYLGAMAAGFGAGWLVVATFVFRAKNTSGSLVTVPAVIGLPYDSAVRRLAAVGLEAVMGDARPSSTVARSLVLAQSPLPGTRLEAKGKVTLEISAGQRRATVPPLAGLSEEEALALLRRRDLRPGTITRRPSTESRGTVLSSDPDAGAVVPEASTVDIVVSEGPDRLAMPDVVGRPIVEARALLEQLGLPVATILHDSSSTFPPGVVVSQNPPAGAAIAGGSAITLRVSVRP